MSDLGGLLHDAVSLYGFVKFLKQHCEEQEASRTYADTSVEFLKYVRDLADETLQFLQRVVDEARRTRQRVDIQRQKLVIIKAYWGVLHELVKPATDAHTLRVPSPLLLWLQEALAGLPGLTNPRIVTLVSERLNYGQHPRRELRAQATELRGRISGTVDFPKGLGLIEMPYSQRSGLFTNVLMCHELGHFVFEERFKKRPLSRSPLSRDVDDALTRVAPQYSGFPRKVRAWVRSYLEEWSEEIYCDLFALRMAGPAFSFASVELFNILRQLDPPVALRFSDTHPAVACRFKEHLAQLRKDGWWPAIRRLNTAHLHTIRGLAREDPQNYTVSNQVYSPLAEKLMTRAFIEVLPAIYRLVDQTIPKKGADVKDFLRYNRDIGDYLNHGVVPSTVATAQGPAFPAPVSIINSSFCFYLESLGKLIAKTGYGQNSVADRSRVAGRVEMWGMKAVEDYFLLSRQSGS